MSEFLKSEVWRGEFVFNIKTFSIRNHYQSESGQ